MKTRLLGCLALSTMIFSLDGGRADGRGFGGFGGGRSFGGSASFGGFRAGGSASFSGTRSFGGDSFGGFRNFGSSSSISGARGDFSGSRSTSSYSGWRGAGASTSYDRSYTTNRGGTLDASGTRSAGVGRFGGAAAGGTRDVSATTAGGRSFSSSTSRGAAVGPYGRTVGGSTGFRSASGPAGSVSQGWRSAFSGTRFPTDMGLSRYGSVGAVGVRHSTTYWSAGVMHSRAGVVRSGFGYYNCFRPTWFTAHPGCWVAAGWTANAAWRAATWASLASFCSIPAQPINYDYGDTVVYQDNSVYINGADVGTAANYTQQATTIADKGQTAAAPPTEEWKALGVFALVQGDEKNSNNIFQLAVNKDGIIRGNYYDGLMDSTTPVYGSVDQKTQRAAWTIGKKNDRVFDAGIFNLTKAETPVLVHLGSDNTQQWMLVRVEEPKTGASSD